MNRAIKSLAAYGVTLKELCKTFEQLHSTKILSPEEIELQMKFLLIEISRRKRNRNPFVKFWFFIKEKIKCRL